MEKLQELNGLVDNSGFKKGYLAQELGISRYMLNKKLNGKDFFNIHEAKILSHLLRVDLKKMENMLS